jgi:hypothetical protein
MFFVFLYGSASQKAQEDSFVIQIIGDSPESREQHNEPCAKIRNEFIQSRTDR